MLNYDKITQILLLSIFPSLL